MNDHSDQKQVTGVPGADPAGRCSGFTLMEFIVVIVLLGILAAFAFPRLNILGYQQTGFFQQSLAAIRYAQQQAIGSGCHVQVMIDASGCNLTWTGGPVAVCPGTGTPIVNPARGTANFCAGSQPAGNPSANFVFDHIGRPSAAQTINFTNGVILVEAETGYARAN